MGHELNEGQKAIFNLKAQGYTQKQIARMALISQSEVSKVLSGERITGRAYTILCKTNMIMSAIRAEQLREQQEARFENAMNILLGVAWFLLLVVVLIIIFTLN